MTDFPNAYTSYDPPCAEPSDKTCDYCRDPINVGDEYYDFDGKIVCEDCLYKYADEHKHVAEEYEPDYD
jgi:hypothetical protein